MAPDRDVLDFCRSYTEAWNSGQPTRVADHERQVARGVDRAG